MRFLKTQDNVFINIDKIETIELERNQIVAFLESPSETSTGRWIVIYDCENEIIGNKMLKQVISRICQNPRSYCKIGKDEPQEKEEEDENIPD